MKYVITWCQHVTHSISKIDVVIANNTIKGWPFASFSVVDSCYASCYSIVYALFLPLSWALNVVLEQRSGILLFCHFADGYYWLWHQVIRNRSAVIKLWWKESIRKDIGF